MINIRNSNCTLAKGVQYVSAAAYNPVSSSDTLHLPGPSTFNITINSLYCSASVISSVLLRSLQDI